MTNYMKRFTADRNRALQTLDENKIRRFLTKHDIAAPTDIRAFWIMVHTAIKDCSDFDDKFRANSIHWLDSRGYVNQRHFKRTRHVLIRMFGTRLGNTDECVLYEWQGKLRAVPLWRKPKKKPVVNYKGIKSSKSA